MIDALRTRRWLLVLYAVVGVIWWWLVQFHESPVSPAPMDGLDVAWLSGLSLTLGMLWLWAIMTRRSWPLETLGLHAIISGDLVLYGLIALANRRGWIDADAAVLTDLLRASVSVGAVVLAGDRLGAAWGWWRERAGRTGWAAVPAPDVTLAALSQAMPLIWADADGRIRNATISIERLTGYRLDEVLGQNLTMLIPERFRARHKQGFDHYLRTGESAIVGNDTALDVVLLRKDGSELPASLVLATIVEDGKRWFVGGLTQRVDVLMEQAERLATASERTADATERIAGTGGGAAG